VLPGEKKMATTKFTSLGSFAATTARHLRHSARSKVGGWGKGENLQGINKNNKQTTIPTKTKPIQREVEHV